MIRARIFREHQPPLEAAGDAWLELPREPDSILWLDLDSPTDAELANVQRALGIDACAAEIARRVSTRPSLRIFRTQYLVTARYVEVDESARPQLATSDLDLVVGDTFVVSVHTRPVPFFDEISDRIAAFGQLGRFDPSYLLYVLLDALVVHFSRQLDEVEDQVERLEEEMLRDPGSRGLNDAIVMQRHVYGLRRLIAPHREPFAALVAPDSPVTPENVEVYFRDIVAYHDSVVDRIDHVRDIVVGSYNLYISNISHRTNQELRVLTFLSAVLLPMTVITGVFGTNFKLSEYDAWEPFYVMLAGMALITVGMLAFFRWRGWL